MAGNPHRAAQPHPGGWTQAWLPRVLALHAEVFRRLAGLGWSTLDLVVRIGLAQQFFVSGLLKVTNWQAALYLAENEYRVSWMNPVTAAYTGAAIEVLCPILLIAGLFTRYTSIPMLILTLVVQFNYNAVDSQLFSAVLLGWLVI